MFRTLLLWIFVFSFVTAYGQSQPYKNVEFGIDLIFPIVVLTGHETQQSDVEIFYKENLPEGDLRFKMILTTGYRAHDFLGRVTVNSVNQFNFFLPEASYAANLGYARNSKLETLHMYYGADLHVGYNKGSVMVSTTYCEPSGDFPECEEIQRIGNQNYTLGIIPFLGTKIPLSDRFFFTVEFGIDLFYTFGKWEYPGIEGVLEEFPFGQFEPRLDKWINDIAISYRF